MAYYRRRRFFGRRRRFRGMRKQMAGYRRRTGFELKLVDDFGTISGTLVGAPQFHLCNGIIAGSNFWGRVGSRISMKSLLLRITIGHNATYDGTPNLLRICLVYDKQAQGTTFTNADLFSYIDNSGSMTSSPIAPVNPQNRDRFIVLMDKMIYESGRPTTSVGEGPTYNIGRNNMIKKYIRLRNLETLYGQGNTGTISDIMSGSLYVVFLTTAATAAAFPFTLYCTTRLRWTD